MISHLDQELPPILYGCILRKRSTAKVLRRGLFHKMIQTPYVYSFQNNICVSSYRTSRSEHFYMTTDHLFVTLYKSKHKENQKPATTKILKICYPRITLKKQSVTSLQRKYKELKF